MIVIYFSFVICYGKVRKAIDTLNTYFICSHGHVSLFVWVLKCSIFFYALKIKVTWFLSWTLVELTNKMDYLKFLFRIHLKFLKVKRRVFMILLSLLNLENAKTHLIIFLFVQFIRQKGKILCHLVVISANPMII